MALQVNRTRSGKGFRLHKPKWIDPYPEIPGTEPEKRVFAVLRLMNIYFIFQGQVPEFEKGNPFWTLAPPNYKPDFVLPEYRLIIDPFSPFHHSKKEAVERDVRKVAAYSVAGYAYYHPWAIGPGLWTWDQYHDNRKTLDLGSTRIRLYEGVNAARNKYRNIDRELHGNKMGSFEMLMSIPELRRGPMHKLTDPRDIKAKQHPGYRIGEYLGAGATGVGAANRSRRRPRGLSLTVGQRRTLRRP